MSSQAAPGRLEVVREFVNSVDLEKPEGDELGTPEALAAWAAEKGLGGADAAELRVTAAELKRAVALREALRELLLGHHGGDYAVDPEAARVVDATARRAALAVRFDAHGVAALAPAAAGVDAVLGELLAIVAAAQADGTWDRLKACPWETCKWAFYDHSKNRSGVWCNMAVCGNRAKARAHRERQRAARKRSSARR